MVDSPPLVSSSPRSLNSGEEGAAVVTSARRRVVARPSFLPPVAPSGSRVAARPVAVLHQALQVLMSTKSESSQSLMRVGLVTIRRWLH